MLTSANCISEGTLLNLIENYGTHGRAEARGICLPHGQQLHQQNPPDVTTVEL